MEAVARAKGLTATAAAMLVAVFVVVLVVRQLTAMPKGKAEAMRRSQAVRSPASPVAGTQMGVTRLAKTYQIVLKNQREPSLSHRRQTCLPRIRTDSRTCLVASMKRESGANLVWRERPGLSEQLQNSTVIIRPHTALGRLPATHPDLLRRR